MACNTPTNTPCTTISLPSTPPGLSPGGKYLVVIDENGQYATLGLPDEMGVLVFDGENVYWGDGSDDRQVAFGDMKILADQTFVASCIFGFNFGSNRMIGFVNDTNTKCILKSRGGEWFLEPDTTTGLSQVPVSGSGILVKPAADVPHWESSNGIVYVAQNSEPALLPMSGTEGDYPTVGPGGSLIWKSPTTGDTAIASNSNTLYGVKCRALSVTSVNIKAPRLTVSDGVDEMDLTNINVTVDPSNPNGLLGLDVGGEAVNTWYYIYVTSDGIVASAIISANPNAPDLSGTTHTFYAFVSVFRNNGSADIVPYAQRDNYFETTLQIHSDDTSITTAFAAVPVTTSLAALVPPIVKTVSGIVGGSGNQTNQLIYLVASTSTGIGYQVGGAKGAGLGGSGIDGFHQDINSFQDLIIDDPAIPVIYWKSSQNNNHGRLGISGYRI